MSEIPPALEQKTRLLLARHLRLAHAHPRLFAILPWVDAAVGVGLAAYSVVHVIDAITLFMRAM